MTDCDAYSITDAVKALENGAEVWRRMWRKDLGGAMNAEMSAKYKRLQDRLEELRVLNGNIARLAFYVNENQPEGEGHNAMIRQLDAMKEYRDELQRRVENGWY